MTPEKGRKNSIGPVSNNRKMNLGMVFLTGLLVGVVCYLIAESLIPKVPNPTQHDLCLANRLGFLYSSLAGIWLGWIQRSWHRALWGVAVGTAIGFAYMILCSTMDFFAIMVIFPCMLGGALALLNGSNQSHWLWGSLWRFGKGLLAGVVLGWVYMFTLQTVFGWLTRPDDYASEEIFAQTYVHKMWLAGPIALGFSSALFFILIRWAVGLAKVKLQSSED